MGNYDSGSINVSTVKIVVSATDNILIASKIHLERDITIDVPLVRDGYSYMPKTTQK